MEVEQALAVALADRGREEVAEEAGAVVRLRERAEETEALGGSQLFPVEGMSYALL